LTKTSDGQGGWSEAWVSAGTCACRLDFIGGAETVNGAALLPYSRAIVTMPQTMAVSEQNRFNHSTGTYSVQSVNMGSWLGVKRATVELITATPVTPIWYLTDGVSAADTVRAYQPIGAASLADSYSNLVNPGTGDAEPGVAPTWSAADGWNFNGSTQYLDTGVIPASSWTMLCRFSDIDTNAGGYCGVIGIYNNVTPQFFYIMPFNVDTASRDYGAGTVIVVNTGSMLQGIMGIAQNQPFMDGLEDGAAAALASWSAPVGNLKIYIGALNDGTPFYFFPGKIQAVAIYNKTLTAEQVLHITTQMMLL
jgi:hypothetical protein